MKTFLLQDKILLSQEKHSWRQKSSRPVNLESSEDSEPNLT